MKISSCFLFAGIGAFPLVVADINWPAYNQQCRDDAGPPYLDDEPGVKYHAASAAFPVLPNGECSDPLKPACASRPDAKTAYLEGAPKFDRGNGVCL